MANYIKSFVQSIAAKAVNFIGFNPSWNIGGGSPNWKVGGGSIREERNRYSNEMPDPLWSSMVMAAVKWHLNNIHEAPMQVVKYATDGEIDTRSSKHSVLDLIENPNDYYDGQTLISMMTVSRVLNGNGYCLKLRGGNADQVKQLWFEPWYTIRPRCWGDGIMSNNDVVNTGKFIEFYEVYRPIGWGPTGGRWVRVETEDVIHTRFGVNPSCPMLGMSPYEAVLAEVFTDTQRAHFTATVLSKVGMIPFVVSPRDNSVIKPRQAEILKEELVSQARGNRGEPIIAGRAIRIDELGFSPADMDLGALASISEERVASNLGPNAYVLGFIPENSIFSNFVEARRDAMESYSVPLHKKIARDFTRDLLWEFESDHSLHLEYNFRNVLAMAEYWASQFDMWGKAYRDGIVERYDARKALMLKLREGDGVEGPDYGDHVYQISGNTGIVTESSLELAGRDPQITPPAAVVLHEQTQMATANQATPPRTATTRGNDRPRAGKNRGTALGGKPPSGRK